jgi:hypothetical protein
MLVQWELKRIHEFLVLFFLFYHQLIILLFTQLPEVLIRLNEDVFLKRLKTLGHFWVNFKTDARDYFAETVGFAEFLELFLYIRMIFEGGFELDKDLLGEEGVMEDFTDLVFLGGIEFVDFYPS